ncbi:hypothetical protein [Variovorax paradoxus]|uniref:Uncharacterized protein n=1 Tax=Variovorax paradoxus (strain EPS) TaxID=595537 RepID=E6UY72_VARPE|nr:hypothetical protein [Variovorax paradoxus]ADU36602.1 hypothetical protein Varpa_2400 [Variovorax paradoxus EPS]
MLDKMAVAIIAVMKTPSAAEHLNGMGIETIGGTCTPRRRGQGDGHEGRPALGAGMQRASAYKAWHLGGMPLLDELEEKYAN